MIGNLVQNQFSAARNWPFGSAASFIVMALVLVAVHAVPAGEGPGPGRGADMSIRPAALAHRRHGRWSTLFLHLPILVLVVFSFNDSKFSVDWRGFTLQLVPAAAGAAGHPARPQGEPDRGRARPPSSPRSSAPCIALALARHRFRGRTPFEGFLYVPIVTPEIVVGISLLILFALLKIPLGLTTITIAHVAFCISFVVIVVLARLEGMDGTLEEAAMILGADEITTFWKVTVPQLWPGILSGALLAFTMSFDDFVITSFVSGSGSSTLPIVVYGMVRRNVEPSINAISTIILLVTTALIYLADRLAREKIEPGAGRWNAGRDRAMPLGRGCPAAAVLGSPPARTDVAIIGGGYTGLVGGPDAGPARDWR